MPAHLEWLRGAQTAWDQLSWQDPRVASRVRDALEGCASAADELGHRLRDLDYPVERVRRPPAADITALLARARRLVSEGVPPQLAAFWRVVGELSFVDYSAYAHVDFWSDRGCASLTGALAIDGLSEGVLEHIQSELEDRAEGPVLGRSGTSLFELPLSPDDLHRDNISGGPPFSMRASTRWNEAWLFDGWNEHIVTEAKQIDLVSYLRIAILECGGFPGLRGDPRFEELRPRLVEGLTTF